MSDSGGSGERLRQRGHGDWVTALLVVASPQRGYKQHILHGQSGFICPLESTEFWEEDLLQSLLKPKVALATGKFMREEHRGLLRPEITAEVFLNLYGLVPSIFRALDFA